MGVIAPVLERGLTKVNTENRENRLLRFCVCALSRFSGFEQPHPSALKSTCSYWPLSKANFSSVQSIRLQVTENSPLERAQ